MKKFDVTTLIVGVAKRFGIELGVDDCDKRKGIVYVSNRGGGLTPMAYYDEALTKPVVCDCTHDAIRMVIEMIEKLAPMLLLAEALGQSMRTPTPEDFTFVYQDEAEEKLLELESTAEADSVINFVKGL